MLESSEYKFTSGSNTLLTVPIGYRPVMGFYISASAPSSDVRVCLDKDGILSAYNYGSENNNVAFSMTYLTSDNPPS